MPSYLATSNNDAIKTAEQVLLDGTQTIAGVEDVLVDGQSVVRDNVAHIDLSGKQDRLTVTEDLTLSGAELGVNKEKIQEKLSAGNNIEIIDNVISAKTVQPNIDSIAVNGTALTPDENKQVNITIDKATIDLANVDNTSDINKPVSTAQQAAINAVADKLNKDLITAVSTELNGDTLNINVTTENLSTGTTAAGSSTIISTATQDSAGLMSANDVKTLVDIASRVSRLEGKTTRLLYTASTNPTKEQIDEFVRGLGYTDYEGIAVVIKDTYHIWHYYANDNIGWRDDGQDTVSNFTNDVPGLIKGANQVDGRVYAETDGTGSVYGWDALKAQVEENKSNLANKADVSSLNSKLDSVTSVTPVNQAYTKKADGTQIMENIYVSAEPNSIAYRDENGRLKAADGDADDDVLTRGQYNTYIAAAVSGLEHADNKVTAITDEGSDVQYPTTKAVVDYVTDHPCTAYHIELKGASGTLTTDQYNKLLADTNSYILFTSGPVYRLSRASTSANGNMRYQKFVSNVMRYVDITAEGAWTFGSEYVESTGNKVTALNSDSTNVQYPSAKVTYDYGQTIQTNAQTYANTAETNAKAYADTQATTAETNAKAYADSLIGNVNEWLTKIDSGEGV